MIVKKYCAADSSVKVVKHFFFIFKGENINIQIEYSICSPFYRFMYILLSGILPVIKWEILLLCVVPLLNFKKGVDT